MQFSPPSYPDDKMRSLSSANSAIDRPRRIGTNLERLACVADDFDCRGVFLHAGIKFPWFVFFQKDLGLRLPDPPWNMRLAMIFFAALCIGLGVGPQPLYAMLPFAVDFVPYTASHVVFYLQLLLFSGLSLFLMLGWLKRTLTITLDVDWLYRKPGAPCLRDAWTSRWTPRGLALLRRRPTALGDSSASFRSITRQRAFSPAPGRPAAWRFGARSFSRHIWPCRT